ncbi:MAG: DUF6507 family protein [Arachnia sp.]
MSKWKLQVPGVNDVLEKVSTGAENFSKALPEDNFEGMLQHAQNGITGGESIGLGAQLYAALVEYLTAESATVTSISHHIQAGMTGVSYAAGYYQGAQESMSGQAQAAMLSSAQNGDFAWFDEHREDFTWPTS